MVNILFALSKTLIAKRVVRVWGATHRKSVRTKFVSGPVSSNAPNYFFAATKRVFMRQK